MGDLFVKALPSLQLIVGAEDRAPTRDEARNLQFIRQLMRNEIRLASTTDLQTARQIYRTLLQASWPVSLLWQRSHFFSRDWQGPIASIPTHVAATFPQANATVQVAIATLVPSVRSEAVMPATRTAKPPRGEVNTPMLSPREAIDILQPR
jgi:hypothetical protein